MERCVFVADRFVVGLTVLACAQLTEVLGRLRAFVSATHDTTQSQSHSMRLEGAGRTLQGVSARTRTITPSQCDRRCDHRSTRQRTPPDSSALFVATQQITREREGRVSSCASYGAACSLRPLCVAYRMCLGHRQLCFGYSGGGGSGRGRGRGCRGRSAGGSRRRGGSGRTCHLKRGTHTQHRNQMASHCGVGNLLARCRQTQRT